MIFKLRNNCCLLKFQNVLASNLFTRRAFMSFVVSFIIEQTTKMNYILIVTIKIQKKKLSLYIKYCNNNNNK